MKRPLLTLLLATITLAASAQAKIQTKIQTKATAQARKPKYVYQTNAGYTVYFNDGTYARQAGEYTDKDLKNDFKQLATTGKWAIKRGGVIEDNETYISFKFDDGTPDPSWTDLNHKK